MMCEVPSSHFLPKGSQILQYVMVIWDLGRIKNVNMQLINKWRNVTQMHI